MLKSSLNASLNNHEYLNLAYNILSCQMHSVSVTVTQTLSVASGTSQGYIVARQITGRLSTEYFSLTRFKINKQSVSYCPNKYKLTLTLPPINNGNE